MKKGLIILALCLAMFMVPQQSRAAQDLEVVLMDCLWGTGIGALAGAATLAFMDHPSDHYNRIVQGGAIGLFCGLGYGLFQVSPTFYSYTTPSGHKERFYGLTVNVPLH